jgi:putative spermidine/putrescine transport system ATP-binding protein
VLIRPEGLSLAAVVHGQAIVMAKTFLGAVTRATVLIEGDTMVQVDRPSDEMAIVDVGAAVEVTVIDRDVLVSNSSSGSVAREPVGAASDGANGS